MIIDIFSENDIAALKELQPPNWPDITISHKFYLTTNYCKTLKLVNDNKIIGVGTSIIHNEVVWLAQIIIHPDWRNHGLGRFITQALMNELTNFKSIYLIATEMGEPVYTKLNFTIETEYIFFKHDEFALPRFINIHIQPFSEIYLKDLIDLDKYVSGENRIDHLQTFLTHSYLYVKDNKLEGYYVPSFGDGLIVALNPIAGLALMELRIQSKKDACIPIENTEAINFIKYNSFKEYRRAKRMYIGEKIDFKPKYVYNRVSGQIG